MITRRLGRRVSRMETRILPKDDGTFTMEELCRAMWRRNPDWCLQISREPGEVSFCSWVQQFQAEDESRR